MRGALLLTLGAIALALSSTAEARSRRQPPPTCDDLSCGLAALFAPATPVTRIAGLTPVLAAKVAEITASCGSQVISGIRHTMVAGTRTISLHASGRAVDMRGNPGCIYARLAGWPGGYTTDYARMRHIHISYGGREDGLRFRHGGHRKARHRRR